jgi:hypothetical protein
MMTKKFGNPVGIPPTEPADLFALQVFPNPATGACNVTFTLDKPGRVRLSLISMSGRTSATWLDRRLDRGTHRLRFPTTPHAPGLYQVMLEQGGETAGKKLVIVR